MKKLHIDFTPEVKARFKAHADKWIAKAMSTEPADREKIVRGVKGMYAAAKLKEPRVVIVPSPLVMAQAYGIAAGVWWIRKNPGKVFATIDATRAVTSAATDAATRAATDAVTYAVTDAATYAVTSAATDDATYDATNDATSAATRAATYAVTSAATDDATYDATRDATIAATRDVTRDVTYDATNDATSAATRAATDDATSAATDDATYDATRDATRAATSDVTDIYTIFANGNNDIASFFKSNAKRWSNVYQGGNMWASYICYLTSFRDLGYLNLKEYEVLKHYEDAAEGGFRVMHEEFCLVCDTPEILKKDENNQAHCDDGPSHRWRDGWSLYHIHGVRVTAQIVMRPETLTVEQINNEENAEVKRIMIDRFGAQKYLTAINAKPIHADVWHGLMRGLYQVDDLKYLFGSDNSTGRTYVMAVDPDSQTCKQAHESICGFDESLIAHQS